MICPVADKCDKAFPRPDGYGGCCHAVPHEGIAGCLIDCDISNTVPGHVCTPYREAGLGGPSLLEQVDSLIAQLQQLRKDICSKQRE